MPAPAEYRKYIEDLVNRYTLLRGQYLNPAPRDVGRYNETQLRREFVDPFFRALGWDVDNNEGHSEVYKDVVHEDPIPIRGTTKFIDYSFRIGGIRKYIVETKRPSSRIKDDREAALQLRRYAWSAKLPLNILTNFEEWAIYDCTKKPEQGDAAGTARIEYFTYDTLLEKWDDLVGIFAKERILQGSFDQFVTSAKGKRGTISVDKDFLDTIDEWRELLAQNLALRNGALSVEDLNIAVQRIIDRIIFLRIGEDRGIEKYETLRNLLDGDGVYPRLCELFRRADDRYNSGLFHFSAEPGWDEVPDRLTPGLTVDDRVLKTIIKQLYYPVTPYEFSAIPPAILGHVYEQFLGKVIRLTDGHKAKVEYKPEVKKAGGVFYTPDYIVDYIVRETVGRLVEGKAPEEVAAIRVLDPACGSGSFLLGAYQFLLNWHLDWYIANLVPKLAGRSESDPAVLALLPKVEAAARRGKTELRPIDFPIYRAGKRRDEKGKEAGSDWRLTTTERKRILLNNIHGVDIDQQAVEVTKLSLLLKVLEEETAETITGQTTLGTERALPSLHKNIRCGNSLIGSDVLAAGLLSPEEIARINPFDWEREFPSIVAAGGFDAVIGNPPYVRQELISAQKEYLKEHYQVYSGTADLYTYFFERALSLLNDHGQFSFIVANKWMRANYGKPLRQFLKTKRIEEIVDFGDLPVFENATTYPCIIRIAGGGPAETFAATNVESLQFEDLNAYVEKARIEVKMDSLKDEGWSLVDSDQQHVLDKIVLKGVPLSQFVNGQIFYGIKTGLNKAFVIDPETRDILISEDPQAADIIKPFLIGKDIRRYGSLSTKRFVLYLPWHFPLHEDKSILGNSKKSESEFKRQFPAVFNHFLQFKGDLLRRNPAETCIRYEWYALQRFGASYWREFSKNKILWPGISGEITAFTLDEEGYYGNDNRV